MTKRRVVRAGAGVRGFSLLELMLVLAIIGVLMAVVSINVLSSGTKAKVKATQASMSTIQTALTSYNLEYSAFPPTLESLKAVKLIDQNKPFEDGWQRPLVYDPRGRNADQPYVLASPGPNGTMGDEDDIDLWTMLQSGTKTN